MVPGRGQFVCFRTALCLIVGLGTGNQVATLCKMMVTFEGGGGLGGLEQLAAQGAVHGVEAVHRAERVVPRRRPALAPAAQREVRAQARPPQRRRRVVHRVQPRPRTQGPAVLQTEASAQVQ